MAFLDKNGLQTLTNKLVQGDAIKVASHRGHTVANVIDNITRECENIATPNTMTLENRVSEFRVGKGRDVDVSGDVEEGKVEVELQGKTWQNLIPKISTTDWQIRKDYGEIFEDGSAKLTKHTAVDFRLKLSSDIKCMIKPNTVYTFAYTVVENYGDLFIRGQNSYPFTETPYKSLKKGFHIYKLTSKSTITESMLQIYYTDSNSTIDAYAIIKDIILLEGDHTQTPIEELPKYFEGIKSSFENGVVEVEIQGKNLVDGSYTLDMDNKRLTTSYIKVEQNTAYTCSFNGVIFTRNSLIQYDSNKRQISASSFPLFFITSQDTHFVKLQWYNKQGSNLVITEDMVLNADIQLEKRKTSTSYEPFYKKKISFNIGEPFRSLPNGVCDEIRNNNGQWELVRRTATAIINGTESWERSYSGWNNIVFCCSDNYFPGIRSIDVNTKNVIANTLPSLHIGALCSGLGNTGICSHNWSTKKLQVAIKDIDTVEELKAWFANNPTEIIYELTNPIITPIDPIEFNTSQGATVSINSDIAPVSTYDAVLNRAGQIEQSISLIADLRNRVNTLESIYDSNLLATQYKLDNLKLNYELEREEDKWLF